ncbi:hypothetical protein C7974DRAFT_444635 [Boeremia exigua]|uniref:uncharacterized protein n=1 Tax=Boeremia exigua TaxID=749465 RepID=UPI001E8D1DEE|nr:uncharacterized protein C7974DRAFT_444635 [Boeremia exigua]KAH6613076.1 hypothetical protein C7974DRAFT_444635 [Boeremia exigua]
MYLIPFIICLNMPLKNRILVSIAPGLSILAFTLAIYRLTIFGDIFAVLAEDPTCEVFAPHVPQHGINLSAPLYPHWARSSAQPEAKFGSLVAMAMTVGPSAREDAAALSTEVNPAPAEDGTSSKGLSWMTKRGH